MITLISTALTKKGCNVGLSPRDADVHIVKATLKRSRHITTTLASEDTYLLILLLHYPEGDNKIIYFLSGLHKQSKKLKEYNFNLWQ